MVHNMAFLIILVDKYKKCHFLILRKDQTCGGGLWASYIINFAAINNINFEIQLSLAIETIFSVQRSIKY